MAEQIWLNGTLVPAADATLSAFDHGLTVGDGIFETLRATDRVVWAPSRHLARLRRSAAILGIEVPSSDDELRAAMQRSEEHPSELQSLMRISYPVLCSKKKT